jgi:hypothetical protein
MNCSSHSARQAKHSFACFALAPQISLNQWINSSSLPLSNRYCPNNVFAVSNPSSSRRLPRVEPMPATEVHGLVPSGSDVKHWCFWLVDWAIVNEMLYAGLGKCQRDLSLFVFMILCYVRSSASNNMQMGDRLKVHRVQLERCLFQFV